MPGPIPQRGYTMIEVAAVLVIAALVVALAVSSFNSMGSAFDAQITRRNAESLMSALDGFYEQHCASGANPAPTIAQLVADEHLESADLAESRFGADLAPAVLWGNPTRIQVSSTITAPIADLDALASSLDADYRLGNRLFWERVPSTFGRLASIDQIAFKQLHEPGVCQ